MSEDEEYEIDARQDVLSDLGDALSTLKMRLPHLKKEIDILEKLIWRLEGPTYV